MKLWEEIVWAEPKHFIFFFTDNNNISTSDNNDGSSEKVTRFLPSYSKFVRNKHYHIILILRIARKQKQGRGL